MMIRKPVAFQHGSSFVAFSSIKHWDLPRTPWTIRVPLDIGCNINCGSKLKDPWTKLTYQSILILTFSSLMCDRSSLQLHAMNLLTCSERRCALGAIFGWTKVCTDGAGFVPVPTKIPKQMGLPFVIFPSFFHCGATIYHEIFSGQVSLKPVWSPLKHCRFDIVV